MGDDTCLFRASDNCIIPYRSYELAELEEQPITEVVIGPKNRTPVDVVENFLVQNGFLNVSVVLSEATYR